MALRRTSCTSQHRLHKLRMAPVRACQCPRGRSRSLQVRATIESTVTTLRSIVQESAFSSNDNDFYDANFPTDAEGRTLHLGTKPGEMAQRILSVGSMDRALLVADLLDDGTEVFQHLSGRGFLTITGSFSGTPISIVTTLMGMPNMDFVVRESRAVTEGTLAIVRLGTCGALRLPAQLGDLLVASKGAICIRRDPDAWTFNDGRPYYTQSAPVAADPQLSGLLVACCQELVGRERVQEGLNATADSFYSSQGRITEGFSDHNQTLLDTLLREHPDLLSLEMETFQLLDLARCSGGGIKAAAFCIAAAERHSNRFISKQQIKEMELLGGKAALTALTRLPLQPAPASAASSNHSSSSSTINSNGSAGSPVAVVGGSNGSKAGH